MRRVAHHSPPTDPWAAPGGDDRRDVGDDPGAATNERRSQRLTPRAPRTDDRAPYPGAPAGWPPSGPGTWDDDRRSEPRPGHGRNSWAGQGAGASGRARAVPVVVVLLLACLAAAGLGVMGQEAGDRAFRGSWEFSRLGGPWLLTGFVGGAVGGWRRGPSGLLLGIVVGAVIVGAGSVAYYGLSWWDGGNDARRAAKLGIGWGLAGVAVGGVLGLLGAAFSTALGRRPARRTGRLRASWLHGAALGILGGLLVGEAVALLLVWDAPGLQTMAVLEGLGGAALVAFGCLGRSWRFVVAVVTAGACSVVVAPIATTVLRETLRSIGWAGA